MQFKSSIDCAPDASIVFSHSPPCVFFVLLYRSFLWFPQTFTLTHNCIGNTLDELSNTLLVSIHLAELANQTGQFVKGMYQFQGYSLPWSFEFLQNSVYQFGSDYFSTDFPAPSLKDDTIVLQTGPSGRPFLENGEPI